MLLNAESGSSTSDKTGEADDEVVSEVSVEENVLLVEDVVGG